MKTLTAAFLRNLRKSYNLSTRRWSLSRSVRQVAAPGRAIRHLHDGGRAGPNRSGWRYL